MIVIKCSVDNSHKTNFLACESLPLISDNEEIELAEKLNQVLGNMGYKDNLVIMSLPHKFATRRYLKIPTQVPHEIEKIVALQAATFLPSSFKELVTGFLIVSTGKQGYSDVNLAIVQKDIIEYYVKVFNKLAIKKFKITLSSYGLSNLGNFIEPNETSPVMIIEIDSPKVELAVYTKGGMIFSRFFNMPKQENDWLLLFIEEVNKTKEAFLKEIPGKEPAKIIVVGSPGKYKMFEQIVDKLQLPVKVIPYWEKISCSENFKKSIQDASNSLAGIVGLGLREIPESINLMPGDLKAATKNIYERKQFVRIVVLVLAIILVLRISATKNIDNKAAYLKFLATEMNKVEKDAMGVEDLEKRLGFMKSHLMIKPASLDIIYGVYQLMPQNIYLSSFSYEQNNQIALRGQALDLNSVFLFVSLFEKSGIFKKFEFKVKYVSKRKTKSGEIVDFEIEGMAQNRLR